MSALPSGCGFTGSLPTCACAASSAARAAGLGLSLGSALDGVAPARLLPPACSCSHSAESTSVLAPPVLIFSSRCLQSSCGRFFFSSSARSLGLDTWVGLLSAPAPTSAPAPSSAPAAAARLASKEARSGSCEEDTRSDVSVLRSARALSAARASTPNAMAVPVANDDARVPGTDRPQSECDREGERARASSALRSRRGTGVCNAGNFAAAIAEGGHWGA